MDTNKILKSDYLDIVFEGRNKNYGSYELRRKYARRVTRGTIIVLIAAVLIAFGPAIAASMKPKEKPKPPVVMKEVELAEPPPIEKNEPPPPPPPPAPPPPAKPTVQFTPPVIAPDEEVPEEAKPTPPDDSHVAGPETNNANTDPNGIDPGVIDNGTPGGTGPAEPPPPPEIFTYVEQMPEFPGGVNGYLSSNLQYPSDAREQGVEGRTTLRFVVLEDGTVSDVSVVKSAGNTSLDKEAQRVVRGMPKWKPGKQQGKAVRVYYTLPITFKLD